MAEEVVGTASTGTSETPAGQSPADQATSSPTTPTDQAPSETTTPAVPEPTTPAETPKPEPEPKINLYESEEFRNYQATQARQIETERRRAAAAEAQLREQRLSGMNDYQKAEFAAQEANERANNLARQLEMRELEEAKNADMRRLNEKTGIPIERLEKAGSYEQAQEMAMDYLREGIEGTIGQKVEEALNARTANMPDTGGGQPQPVKTENEQAIAAAIEAKDSTAYVAAILAGE